ncbi:MAG TPA: hypothetical protein VHE99_03660 [Gammaproteobacteria bacterium]|nr:hypothetical protein [Gammaproteobacteria bacterium]
MKRLILLVWLSTFLFSPTSLATPPSLDPTLQMTDLPWAVMVYYGRMTNDTLGNVVIQNYSFANENLYSVEFAHQLSESNPVRRFFQPILSTMEVVGNFTYRQDPVGPIYEFNPYVTFRWAHFPWDKYITTTFGLGEGISFDSKVPAIESNSDDQNTTDSPQKVLNYLMLEATFALPDHPHWELVARVHHRSGVFGLYKAENSGSTAIGLGIRYRF